MKTKLTHLKKTIIACCLLFWVNNVLAQTTQNPLWSFPPKYLPMTGTPISLPTPSGGYQGLSSFIDGTPESNLITGPSNMYADENGNPLFFIQGNYIYNSNGYLIDSLYIGLGSGSFDDNVPVDGAAEICIVPRAGHCTQYYIFSASYNDTATVGTNGYAPYYALIDVAAINPHVTGQLGANITSSVATLFPSSNVASLFSMVPNDSLGGQSIDFQFPLYAATKAHSDGSRFLFVVNESYLYIYKLDGSTGNLSYVRRYLIETLTPNSGSEALSDFANLDFTELEVYEDYANSKYKLAFSGNFNTEYTGIVTLDLNYSNASYINHSAWLIDVGSCLSCIHSYVSGIYGIEFSPNGNYLYYTHQPNANDPYTLEYRQYSNPYLGGVLSSDTAYTHAQIELGTDGNLYLLKDSSNITLLQKITTPNTPGTVPHTVLSLSNYPIIKIKPALALNIPFNIYPLPDQIDGEVYGTPQFTTCCAFYKSYDRQTYSAGTAASPGSTWTGSSQTWKANTIANSYQNNPLTLTTSNVVTIGEELRIPAGKTITIQNMTLKFSPQARLIIENGGSSVSGGQLVLQGCTLTVDNRCATDMWPGVQVWGSPAQAEGTGTQGFLHLESNSLIENAYIGVLVGYSGSTWLSNINPAPTPVAPIIPGNTYSMYILPSDTFPGGGGLITSASSSFLNNQRSIVYNAYNGQTAGTNQNLHTTSFTVNSALLNSSVSPRYFIGLYDHAVNVPMGGLSFIDTYTTNNLKDTGIYSRNSTYAITYNTTRSTFANLNYGIYSYNYGGSTATVSSYSCTFTNNNVGIYLGKVNSAIIEKDTFKIRNKGSGNVSGLYLDNCTGYYVQDNNFTKGTNPTSATTRYGIVVNNSGAYANAIFRNTFDNLYKGSQAQYRNYVGTFHSGNGTGLLYLCNIFSSGTISSADIYVPALSGSSANLGGTYTGSDTASGIGNSQGNITPAGGNRTTAGNQFSHTSGGKDFWIENAPYALGSTYRYYSSPGNCSTTSSVYYPAVWNNLALTCKSDSSSPPSCLSGPDGHTARAMYVNPISQAISDAAFYKQQFDSLNHLVDGGSTNDLLNLVSGNNNSSAVYNSLSAAAPYLSNEVLKAYINSNYPASDISQLLAACSPLNNEVNSAVSKSNLSAGIKNQISKHQHAGGTAKIDELANSISSAFTARHLILNEAIRTLVRIPNQDTVAMANALMKEQAMELPARVQVETGLDIHDYAMAAAALTQVEAQEGQSNYVKLSTILLQNTNKSAEQMLKDPSILSQIQAMDADSSDRFTYLKANMLLQLVGKSNYVPYIQENNPTGASSQRNAAQEADASTTVVKSESSLINSPNPFKESTTVKAVIVEKTQNAYIVITDMVGNEIARFAVQQGENNINVNAGNLNQAVMFCTLVVDGVKIKTNKMVLIR